MPEGPQAVRSVVAVGAGFFAIQVLSLGADIVLGEKVSLEARIAYMAVLECLGGYITGWLAIRKPVKHAFVLALIVLALSGAIAVMTWDAALSHYHIITLALVIPMVVLGGKLRELQVRRGASISG